MKQNLADDDYIYTVLGPVLKSSFEGSFGLPYEHLTQDISRFYWSNGNEALKSSQITLDNLFEVQLNPFSCLSNLTLETNAKRLGAELNCAKKQNVNLVLEATTRENGLNEAKLKEISQESKVSIVHGYTPERDLLFTDDKIDFSALHNSLRHLVTFGYQDRSLVPAFLGEVLLNSLSPNDNVSE